MDLYKEFCDYRHRKGLTRNDILRHFNLPICYIRYLISTESLNNCKRRNNKIFSIIEKIVKEDIEIISDNLTSDILTDYYYDNYDELKRSHIHYFHLNKDNNLEVGITNLNMIAEVQNILKPILDCCNLSKIHLSEIFWVVVL